MIAVVVLKRSSVVLLRFMEIVTNVETLNAFCRKLAPSLVTLSQSRQPEIQVLIFRVNETLRLRR